MHFWNAVVGVSSTIRVPALAVKSAGGLGSQDAAGGIASAFQNGHPGSGGLGTGFGQLVGTDETLNAGLQINTSPVCSQRNLAPFP